MTQIQKKPLVSVIVLCFNHARFVVECLETVKAQTFQDFELIIMDDCSSDNSVAIIEDWIVRSRVECRFIAHKVNVGVCQTLNEAIEISCGEYICMMATDDKWRRNRIEAHLAAFASQPPDVAVVYSDTAQIDEAGNPLPETFLEGQRPGFALPSGRIFADLIDRNFVHPLAATIRRSAIVGVGGYDTRLATEDYDMWLRLANQYQFKFVAGLFSDYRIVATSLTRTVFTKPSVKFAYGQFLVAEKWIPSGLLTDQQLKIWSENQAAFAYWLFFHNDPRAARCLRVVAWRVKKFRYFVLAVVSSLGFGRPQIKGFASILGFGGRD